MTAPLRTVLVGVGRIGATWADDPAMAQHIRYATHAQVLADHPEFDWVGAVDRDAAARAGVAARWGVRVGADLADVADLEPEVLVLATPPQSRAALLDAVPATSLKAVVCEKPLGRDLAEAVAFAQVCDARGLVAQVNLWRRGDRRLRKLAAGGLQEFCGRPQAVIATYGNGLVNNGTHVVDWLRMFFGEVTAVRSVGPVVRGPHTPIPDDPDVGFDLTFADGVVARVAALDFREYREVALDVWGTTGRLEVLQEGLVVRRSLRQGCRAMTGADEIASDRPVRLESGASDAFYALATNLAAAVRGDAEVWSPIRSAVRTASVVEAIAASAAAGGAELAPADPWSCAVPAGT